MKGSGRGTERGPGSHTPLSHSLCHTPSQSLLTVPPHAPHPHTPTPPHPPSVTLPPHAPHPHPHPPTPSHPHLLRHSHSCLFSPPFLKPSQCWAGQPSVTILYIISGERGGGGREGGREGGEMGGGRERSERRERGVLEEGGGRGGGVKEEIE